MEDWLCDWSAGNVAINTTSTRDLMFVRLYNLVMDKLYGKDKMQEARKWCDELDMHLEDRFHPEVLTKTASVATKEKRKKAHKDERDRVERESRRNVHMHLARDTPEAEADIPALLLPCGISGFC